MSDLVTYSETFEWGISSSRGDARGDAHGESSWKYLITFSDYMIMVWGPSCTTLAGYEWLTLDETNTCPVWVLLMVHKWPYSGKITRTVSITGLQRRMSSRPAPVKQNLLWWNRRVIESVSSIVHGPQMILILIAFSIITIIDYLILCQY